jgi:hypothetical protein
MSSTFVIALILAIIVLSNLRLFLLIAGAAILALIVAGIGAVTESVAGDSPSTSILGPAPFEPEDGDPAQSSDNLPEAPPEQPR